MNLPPTSEPSRNALRAWRVEPPVDSGFRAAVWARIDASRAVIAENWSAYFRRHAVVWSLVLLVCVSGSALLGQRAGERHTSAERDSILHVYLAEIDARAMGH